jgi:hypothetical protein
LLGYKRRNDKDVDYGLLLHICRKKNIINLDSEEDKLMFEEDIRKFVAKKRKKPGYEGFSTFGVRQALEFLQEKGWYGSLVKSHKELFELYETAPRYERLDIEFEDLMKIIHASDYVENSESNTSNRHAYCSLGIMAHPSTNASRAEDPEALIQYLIDNGIDGFELVGEKKKYKDLIKNCVANSSIKNPMIYTGGSDTHDLTESNTLGVRRGMIIGASDVSQFSDWVDRENYARSHNLPSIRSYDISLEEVELIIAKYKHQLDEINQSALNIMLERESHFAKMSDSARLAWESTIPAKVSVMNSKKHEEKDENYSTMDSLKCLEIISKSSKSKKEKKKVKSAKSSVDEDMVSLEARLANSIEYLAYIKEMEEKYSKSYTYDGEGNVYSISDDE